MTAPSHTDSADSLSRLIADVGSAEGGLTAAVLGLLDRLGLMLAVKDFATGRYVYASPRMGALFGRVSHEMAGCTDADLMDPVQAAPLRAAEQAAWSSTGTVSLTEHRLERGDQRREFSVARTALPRPGGAAPSHLCSLWTEVTALRQRETQLEKLLVQLEQQQSANEALRRESQDPVLRDDALGLYQRTQFDDQLRREADLSAREHRQFSLVSIALDPSPAAVRALGDEARVRILEALGRLLRSNTRVMDASCRVDDHRFAVLLSGVGLATAHARMEGLRRQCATQIVALQGREIGFSVAMGVASFPHTASTQEALVAAADGALAEAIRRGGNCVALAGIRFEAN